MVEKVIWSPSALKTYDEIIEYLLERFGEAAVERFVRLTEDKINLIISRPTMFRLTGKRPNTYITNIYKKTTLTYRYLPLARSVELVVFWGRQSPEKKLE